MPPSFLDLPRTYWVLWVGQFINRLGGFVLTFLPVYLTERHHYRDAEAGAVLSLFGAGGLLGATVGGWSSDRFGRRATIVASTAASALVLLGFAAAPPGLGIAVAAFLLGATNAYGPALTAAVSDVVRPPDRPRAFGYFYWAVNLGFAVAATAGGALSGVGFHWLFVGDALTTLALCAIVLRLVPETRPARDARDDASGAGGPHPLRDPRLLPFALAQFVTLGVFLQAFTTMTLEERARGVAVGDVGLIAALNGVLIVALQPLFVRATRGRSLWGVLALASALTAAGALFASRATRTADFAVAMAVFTAGEIAFSGAAPSYVAHVAPTARRGAYQGAYSLCWAGASLLAPLAGPAARARFGATAMWLGAALLAGLAALAHATLTRRAERG